MYESTDGSVEMVRRKRFSWFWFLVWLFLGLGIGSIIYLVYYLGFKRDTHVTVLSDGSVIGDVG